jgi:DNA-binding SARP family transcriptional activator
MSLATDHKTKLRTAPIAPSGHREPEQAAPRGPSGPRSSLGRDGTSERHAPTLRVGLLGGFRVERADTGPLDCEWPRRSAKTLTKLLATYPGHALHREQIMEILWPGIGVGSALNSFGKALHAARHALEPELPPRRYSTYLRLTDSMLTLDTHHVDIDADRFERMGENALRHGDIAAYGSALAVYEGELLPEDRYEDWCVERRTSLAELRVRLLLRLAEALEGSGAYSESADRLREALCTDPTREDAHRRLIRLWAEIGNRDRAVRQFHVCTEALLELGLVPQQETVLLYQDVVANRVPIRGRGPEPVETGSHLPPASVAPGDSPFVGREPVLAYLRAQLGRVDGRAGMVLLAGEAGVGKTRLLEVLASEASREGAAVLWGGVGSHVSQVPYGPLAVALEGFVSGRPEDERHRLARSYPVLAQLVPSLATNTRPPPVEKSRADQLDFLLAIVRLLTDLASTGPVLLVVGDLHGADPVSLDVLHYFAHLARQRRWLMVGTIREAELQAASRLGQTLETMVREGLCVKVELPCLSRAGCDELAQALCPERVIDQHVLEQIYTRSGGNPLFIEEIVQRTHECSAPPLTNGGWHRPSQSEAGVPARVRALVATQLRPLNETVRRVLELTAAGGAPEISLNELLTAAGTLEPPVSADALFDALDHALQVDILQERDNGYAFRHPLVRSALNEALSKHRREQLRAAISKCHRESLPPLRVDATTSCS